MNKIKESLKWVWDTCLEIPMAILILLVFISGVFTIIGTFLYIFYLHPILILSIILAILIWRSYDKN